MVFPSPDNQHVAYHHNGDLVIAELDRGKVIGRVGAPSVRCSRGTCEGHGITTAAWSPSGVRLAYSVDTGDARSGVYVFDRARRQSQRIASSAVWQMRFDRRGRLVYLTGSGSRAANFGVEVWREGSRSPLVKLPDRATPGVRNGQRNIIAEGFVLTEAWTRNARGYPKLAGVWRTDLATKKARALAMPSTARGFSLAPTSDRVCYFVAKQLRCLELATGKTAVVASAKACGWNDSGGAAWSPSGQRLAFRVCRDPRRRDIDVHDFTTGRTRTVARQVRYGQVAFQTDDHLLLLHRGLSPRWGYLHAVVSRVDLATGERFAAVVDRTSYPYAFASPGRTDRVYLARDRGGTTDTVWVDTSQLIGPSRATTRPRDGRSIEYQANGNPFAIKTYRGGILYGPVAWYDWNGMRIETGQYESGKWRGRWTRWRPNGRIDKIQLLEGLPAGGTRQSTLCWYRWPERKCKPSRANYWHQQQK